MTSVGSVIFAPPRRRSGTAGPEELGAGHRRLRVAEHAVVIGNAGEQRRLGGRRGSGDVPLERRDGDARRRRPRGRARRRRGAARAGGGRRDGGHGRLGAWRSARLLDRNPRFGEGGTGGHSFGACEEERGVSASERPEAVLRTALRRAPEGRDRAEAQPGDAAPGSVSSGTRATGTAIGAARRAAGLDQLGAARARRDTAPASHAGR